MSDKCTNCSLFVKLATYPLVQSWASYPSMGILGPFIDDALIQPYSGHESRKSLEIYSKLAITDAQQEYNEVINNSPFNYIYFALG